VTIPQAPPWIPILRDALDREFGTAPSIAALATVDRDGKPRVRHVVIRQLGDLGALVVATDARSGKACQLRHRPGVELAFWLPAQRLQFRINGLASVISSTDGDPRWRDQWLSLSDATRATFFWPPPGRPFDAGARIETEVAAAVEPPVEFELIVVEPEHVDRLDISVFPHQRARWRAETGWRFEALHP
jgi:PPOX class probable FMN-dependent enzyme